MVYKIELTVDPPMHEQESLDSINVVLGETNQCRIEIPSVNKRMEGAIDHYRGSIVRGAKLKGVNTQ